MLRPHFISILVTMLWISSTMLNDFQCPSPMSAMLSPHFISSNSWSIWWGRDDTTGSSDESGDLLLLSLLSPLSLLFSLSFLLFLFSPSPSSPPPPAPTSAFTNPTLSKSCSTLFIFFWFSPVSTIRRTILSTLLCSSPTVLDTVSLLLSSPPPTTTAPASSPWTTAHTCSVLLCISSVMVARFV